MAESDLTGPKPDWPWYDAKHYTVVFNGKVVDFIRDVNALIEKGWYPQGGVIHSDVTGALFQALVRDIESIER